MTLVHPARHLLRAKDLIDARYREPLYVAALARAAHLSPGALQPRVPAGLRRAAASIPPTRRLQRAAELLRNTDRSVADICVAVWLCSLGSFTTSFGRAFGLSPTAYRAAHPPAAERMQIPTCVLQAYARPRSRTFGEDSRVRPG
jgi:transcriptional regulator GlxA family with amidase domain